MPRKQLASELKKERINVSIDPKNKMYLDRQVTRKKAKSVSAAVNDLITQDRKKP